MSDITGVTNLSSSSTGAGSLTGIKAAVGNLNTDKLEAADVADKATKVTSPTADNFAGLTAGGDLKDSGYKDADYEHVANKGEANGYAELDGDGLVPVNQIPNVSTPSGSVVAYGGSSVPSGWLLCDGASYVRADYSALFTAIGTTYGAADGTHFNVPNLKGRIPVGYDAAQTEFDTLGETGGAKTHTLTTDEIPSHSHNITLNAMGVGSAGSNVQGSSSTGNEGTGTTQAAGTGNAHNNLQPYIALNYIIKA